MKKLYALLLLTATLKTASSQMRLGIMGGPHAASVIEKNYIPGWETNTKPFYSKRSAFHLGLMGEMPLDFKNKFFFQPGILYMAKGRKYERLYDTTRVKTDTLFHSATFYTNYVEVPLNFTMKLRMGKNSNFILSAGPYLGFYFNGKQTTETRVARNSELRYTKSESDIQVGKVENKVSTFDLGVSGRVGFEFGKVMLTGFMSQGLSNFYKASYNSTFKHRVVGGSIGFWIGKKVKLTTDQDGDGVPDKIDGCPDVAGSPKAGGCPDRDGDGVADGIDKCPDVAGHPRYRGCPIPDRDGDGIFDEDDKCPDVPGIIKYNGCPIPDTDGDGINDEEDLCPDKAGPKEFNGCPIPDSDGDGVNDREDKCPTVAGDPANHGCPTIKKEVIEKVNFAAKKIFFALGSDKLMPTSYSALNSLVAILRTDTTLRLVVEGYTDNVGKPASNLILSQKRADAVTNYLIQKGLDANRLEAIGYGQERAVADNSTAEGRAANRRVELKLSQR